MDQEKLKALLEDMTIEEKIDQLLQVCSYYYETEGVITGPQNSCGYTQEEIENAGSVLGVAGAADIKRIQEKYMKKQPHHIPLIFMGDVINGFRTIFPIPLAQGCTFNPELVKRAAEISAKEASAAGLQLTFSPMVDLVRDPRWGRVMETTGEDTYLNRCFAKAIVEGYQGDGSLIEKGRIAACVKHFAGYGAPEAGRDYNTVELSERTFKEDYLPPYEAAVEAGCAAVMSSFNTLDRIPSTANKKLLRNILRKEMGFNGVVISDFAAIEELVYHGVAKNKEEAAGLALTAGVDIDMMTTCYCRNLKKLAEENPVNEVLLNESVLRILQLKNKLGLFENPYKDADEVQEKKLLLCGVHRKTARETAIESMVLLKNDNILPLKLNGQSIAFIGPFVSEQWISGVWSIFARIEDNVSLEMGVKNLEIKNASYAKGCAVADSLDGFEVNPRLKPVEEDLKNKKKLLNEAIENAKHADVVVMALGEHPKQSGEASSRTRLDLADVQVELFHKVYEVNKNIIVVLFNGRPLTIHELNEKAKAILEVWLPGTEGGNAIADVLFGRANPSGKLSMSFPYSVGQIPVFYNELSTGRPYAGNEDRGRYFSKYIDSPNAPLYPFGYGLSYTQIEISEMELSRHTLNKDSRIEASVTVKNTGAYTGKEVIQMYIQDICGSAARPIRELKGFQKIELKPGEERRVTFSITEEMLRFYDINMKYVSEPGEFNVFIGNSSCTQTKQSFILK